MGRGWKAGLDWQWKELGSEVRSSCEAEAEVGASHLLPSTSPNFLLKPARILQMDEDSRVSRLP